MNTANRRSRWHGLTLNVCSRLGVRCLAIWLLYPTVYGWAAAQPAEHKVDFNRDIRPILSENCYKCHGPDDGARKANLRFDQKGEAQKPAKSGRMPVVVGAPEKSEMIARITATDPEKHMPPVQSGKKLKPNQIDLLRRWIAEGAPYAMHWAYVKPVRPELPTVNQEDWPHNPIDRFILARLEKEGLPPSPPAEKHLLIRRVSLDLTGLPPTPAEVDQFVNDTSPTAYEELVNRLLSKPTYGEHWARLWLDLARYADSAGYADDPSRTIWTYRDYVIRSFNQNTPFDRFTIEQIAGDLLPDATQENRVATAFHRNTMTNHEGGTDDEEFRNAAIVDRVNTTMAVWMATSMACAQCHHHKYDPISQEEYFSFFAIFNNSEDADRDDESPVLSFFTDEQKQQRAALEATIAPLEKLFRTPTPESTEEQLKWERAFPLQIIWQNAAGLVRHPPYLAQELIEYSAIPEDVLGIVELTADERNETQRATLSEFYRANIFPGLKSEREAFREAKRQLAAIEQTSVPIMHELEGDKRRKTHVQLRGNFKALAEEVNPGVPAVFPPLPEGVTPDRLALAQWLVSPENPLTARVVANRLWEQIFGTGIVRTVEDFGSQGDLPTHPELLDWLATELVAQGWNIKAFLKELVTSATYCQSSRVTPELQERDPANLLLARGPRYRMSAEEVRDQALFVSGLLSEKMFGPPVRPPQPSLGLSAAFGSSLDWKTSEGEDRYRRALYVEWRRTNPYASLATFDAPNREVCALKRPRSNTPLQALVTLNDPVYVEAAQGLARRMAQTDGPVQTKITYGFELCMARRPRENELEQLVSLYDAAEADFQVNEDKAIKLATDPLGPVPEGMDLVPLAAWTAVGNVLLNLDETLMRP
ncbi:MAG TPA: PSD1 and planctomycete cytochrome C domain-containing protein [Candidatus Limnocylindrales bacterium]|nr:PSD1 and planctomycete cytochrome C domain-containing protein [Candidatus Limnocylindrales bacterium]